MKKPLEEGQKENEPSQENEKSFALLIEELSKDGADIGKVMIEYIGEEKMKKLSDGLVTI